MVQHPAAGWGRLASRAITGFLLILAADERLRAESTERTEMYPNGKPHFVFSFDEQGRKEGAFKEFDLDGKVVVAANYIKGKLDGAYRSFFPGGKPKVVAAYKDGKLYGKYRRFTENGDVALAANYKAGLLHGEQQEFSAGKVTKDEVYTDGALAQTTGLKAGKLHGTHREYVNNKVANDQFWFDGQLLIPKGPQLIMEELAAIQKLPIPVTGEMPRATKSLTDTLNSPSFRADEENGLRTLMCFRFLADLPYKDMEIDRGYAAHCQAGAELLTRINELTHSPKNPGLPEDEYKFAYDGPSHSNISTARESAGSVRMYMDDSDSGNIEQLGHRRWCLNPAMLKTGFGADGKHTCMWSFDGSRKDVPDYDAVAWPPRGLLPTSYFGPGHAWSFSVNPKKYRAPDKSTKVTVTAVRLDPAKGTMDRDSKPLEMDYFNVSTTGYGVSNCVIFRPKGVKVANGSGYMVNIAGLKDTSGKDFPVEYFVGFFTPEGCGAP